MFSYKIGIVQFIYIAKEKIISSQEYNRTGSKILEFTTLIIIRGPYILLIQNFKVNKYSKLVSNYYGFSGIIRHFQKAINDYLGLCKLIFTLQEEDIHSSTY